MPLLNFVQWKVKYHLFKGKSIGLLLYKKEYCVAKSRGKELLVKLEYQTRMLKYVCPSLESIFLVADLDSLLYNSQVILQN